MLELLYSELRVRGKAKQGAWGSFAGTAASDFLAAAEAIRGLIADSEPTYEDLVSLCSLPSHKARKSPTMAGGLFSIDFGKMEIIEGPRRV